MTTPRIPVVSPEDDFTKITYQVQSWDADTQAWVVRAFPDAEAPDPVATARGIRDAIIIDDCVPARVRKITYSESTVE